MSSCRLYISNECECLRVCQDERREERRVLHNITSPSIVCRKINQREKKQRYRIVEKRMECANARSGKKWYGSERASERERKRGCG